MEESKVSDEFATCTMGLRSSSKAGSEEISKRIRKPEIGYSLF
jgi:hypothetical protein